MDIREITGLNIRKYRKLKSLTQENLSEVTGIDRTYISDVERGLRNIAIINLEKIAKALEVNVEKLVSTPKKSENE